MARSARRGDTLKFTLSFSLSLSLRRHTLRWTVAQTTCFGSARESTRCSNKRVGHPTPGPSWGYFKSQFQLGLSTFGDIFPQKRGNGSKNEDMIPPRRALCCLYVGMLAPCPAVERIWHMQDSQVKPGFGPWL